MRLDDGVEAVAGIGPRRAELLRSRGIVTVEDLLLHLPRRYEDRSRVIPIADLEVGAPAGVRGRVATVRRIGGGRRRGRRGRTEARVEDDSGSLEVVWFNQPWVARGLSRGDELILWGKPGSYRKSLQLANPVYELVGDGSAESLHVGRPVPVHRRVGSLTPAQLRRLVDAALEGLEEVDEGLPPGVIRERALMARDEALRQVHYPPREAAVEEWNVERSPAHRRLVLQEFIGYQTALRLQRRKTRSEPGRSLELEKDVVADVVSALPFELTGAQRRCVDEIVADLDAATAMHRLLQGDVGSGKTAVAGIVLLAAARAGWQGALLAPTEILARQHGAALGPWARELGVEVHVLTGSSDRQVRHRVGEALEGGRPAIVVGTHALLQPGVRFRRLGLVVVDEQHRFGVGQRAALGAKGRQQGAHPDLLVMTATPIPRSLALTLYGDLEVSAIDEMPPGRVPVATEVRDPGDWQEMRRQIRERAALGEQTFVVSPRIGDGEEDLRSATELAAELEEGLEGLDVELVHGELAPEDREARMGRFASGRTPVLVATTVVEVGVDVPAATLMIVEHAERFGLAQLHQLRGRVGRGGGEGRCLLVAHAPLSESAEARLATLCRTHDGFEIAEEDLRLRGPGELLGTRQTGAFELRVGNPFDHPDWLAEAAEIARGLATAEDDGARRYRDELRRSWRRRMRLLRAG